VAGLSFNQGVGGSILALVNVSLSKTLNPELLPVATVYELIVSPGYFLHRENLGARLSRFPECL